MITIRIQTEQSVPCITPEGRLDTINSSAFDEAVRPFADNELYLVIDFSQCNYLSSTGIRILLGTFKKLKAKGGSLFISGISSEVFNVLEMAGLQSVFCFSENIEAAREEINRLKQKGCTGSEWETDRKSVV